MRVLRILFFMAAFFVAHNLLAQTTTIISWSASTTTGVANYNVYRAPCTGSVTNGLCSAEGTFAKIGSTVNGTTLTYTDSTVAAGSSYSYAVRAFCTTGCGAGITQNSESSDSNHLGIVVPTANPQPPTLLTITAAFLQRNGRNAQLSAQWVDAPTNSPTQWTLKFGSTLIAGGSKTSANGNYSVNWSGRINPTSVGFTFQVCDSTGTCVSRTV